MDLWDVVRLMLRRWLVAVPMLILTVAGTAWVGLTVKPDYTAQGNISLLPPSLEEATVAGKSRTVNPWDTDSLTGAVAVRLRSKALHDSLVAEGYSGVFEADKDLQFPSVVTIKVTAPTEQQATATARRLLQMVTEEVERQQSAYHLRPGEEITTTVIDDGSNVETATGKIKRALIVVFGIGFVLTMTATVCVDAVVRWRARRAAGGALAAQPVPVPSPAKPSNGAPSPGIPTAGISIRYPSGARSASSPHAESAADVHQPVRIKLDSPAAATDSSADATQLLPSRIEPVGDDSTIVLPLSNAPWATKRVRNAEGNGTEVTQR
jgi:capsular polysaccharide biosynthesis protein